MSAVETGLLVVVILLCVVVVALVRAQASTARRLAIVERRLLRAQRRVEPEEATMDPQSTPEPVDEAAGGDTVDVRGVTVDGEPALVELERPDRPTLVAFLSTTCGICLGLWEQLRDRDLSGVRTVVVTKDPAVEDVQRAAGLARSGSLPVVMSSEAWDDYEVPGSPYFLLVDGTPATVVAEGEASTWDAVQRIAERSMISR
jgi:hypothetical protein